MRDALPKMVDSKYKYLETIPIMISVLCKRIPSDILHTHDCAEIWYALSGEAVHRIGNETYIQKPGSCVAVPAFVPHDIYTSGSEDTPIFTSIHVSDSALRSCGYDHFSYCGGRIFFDGKFVPIYRQFSEAEQESANDIAHSMSDEFSKHKKLNFDKLIDLYISFLRLLGGETCSFKLKPTLIERTEHILQATNYMFANYNERITIEKLCELTYMSRSRFCEYFTKITGVSPMYFLKCIRLNAAQREFMLRGKGLSDIVELVGVYDKAQLARLFKQHYGITLTEFRKENQVRELKFDYETRIRYSDLDVLCDFFANQNTK